MPDDMRRSEPSAALAVRTLATVLRDGARRLAVAGVPEPEVDARRLAAYALGVTAAGLIEEQQNTPAPEALDRFESLLRRRLAREPVARITGARSFWSLELAVTPAVLDPRPETETLVETALDILRCEGRQLEPLRIIDVGTGSGAILLALLSELPNATGVGCDISPAALKVARHNAQAHDLADRANFVVADALTGIAGPFDLLLANPPYIPTNEIETLEPEVRAHDPRQALDGGTDGLGVYRKICSGLGLMHPNSWILFEVGRGQHDAVASVLRGFHVPSFSFTP